MMLNIYGFPKVDDFLSNLADHHTDLVFEATRAFEKEEFLPWPEKINEKDLWKVAGVRWQSKPLNDHLRWLFDIVWPHREMIVNAGYSAMLPGARILPHEGYTNEVLRLHYGLVCPAGDCQIVIDGAHYKWHQKTGLLFDDTLTHEAWNKTDRTRIILLFDIKKDCL